MLYCFTGSQNFANKMLELDFYISASGIITFKKSEELRNIFKTIPDDRLLVETDTLFISRAIKRKNKSAITYNSYIKSIS